MTRSGAATLIGWLLLGAVLTCPLWRDLEALEPGDDWTSYEAMARAVLSGDWTAGGTTVNNGTFLYPYVVAVVHAVLGPRRWPIYLVQYVGIGLACVGMGVLGGPRVLAAANVVALLDVARWYPVRLLSENLLLALLPWTFIAVFRGRRVLGGALLGVIALTRLNLLPFCMLVSCWMAAGSWRRLGEWAVTGAILVGLLGMVWAFQFCCP